MMAKIKSLRSLVYTGAMLATLLLASGAKWRNN